MPEARWKPSMEVAHQARNQGGYTRLEHAPFGGAIPVPSRHLRAPPRRLPPVSSQPKIAPRGSTKPSPADARHAARTHADISPRQITEPLSVADFVAQGQPGYERSLSAENNIGGEQNQGLIELIHQLQGQVQQQQFQFNALASEARENTADLRREIANLRHELSEHTCDHESHDRNSNSRESSKRDAPSPSVVRDQAVAEPYANVMDSPEVQALTKRLVQTDAEVTQLRGEVAALRDVARTQPVAQEGRGSALEGRLAAMEVEKEVEKEVVATVEVTEVGAEPELKPEVLVKSGAEAEVGSDIKAEAEVKAEAAAEEMEAVKQMAAEPDAAVEVDPQATETVEAMAAVEVELAEAAETTAAETKEAAQADVVVDADRVTMAAAGEEVTMASDAEGAAAAEEGEAEAEGEETAAVEEGKAEAEGEETVAVEEGKAEAEGEETAAVEEGKAEAEGEETVAVEEGKAEAEGEERAAVEAAAEEDGKAAAMLSAKVLSAAVESEVGPPTGEAFKAQVSTNDDGDAETAASQHSISREQEAGMQDLAAAVSTTLRVDDDARVRLSLRSGSPSPIRTTKRHSDGGAVQETAVA